MRKLFAVLIATLFVFAATLPAFGQAAAPARTVDFYGNLRMNTYWDEFSRDAAAVIQPGAISSDSDLLWKFDADNSRFGVNIKQGDLFANVELRPNNGSYFRQWYASWDMKWAKLITGFTWTPTFLGGAGCCFDGGLAGGYGPIPNSLRAAQISLDIPVGKGRFWIAGLEHPTWGSTSRPKVIAGAGDTDLTIPRLEARFDQTFGPFTFNVIGGWSSYQEVMVATDAEYDIDAYMYGFKATFAQGPFSMNAQIWGAQNLPQYGGASSNLGTFGAFWNAGTNEIIDSDHWGYGADALFKVTQAVSVGAGYWSFENTRQRPGQFEEEDKDAYYYIYAPITVNKFITITPEIGKFDYKTRTDNTGKVSEEGDRLYFGAYWFISF